MGIIGQIIIGLLMIAGGILTLKNNYQVANTVPIAFAEQYMGGGGSYSAWKILSILLILAGLTVVFGIYDNIIAALLSPITNMISGGSD